MTEEHNCPREDRVLPLIGTYPFYLLPTKKQISKKFKDSPIHGSQILKDYYAWKPGPRDLIIYTGYGYWDVPIPKSYDYLLSFHTPEKSISVQATVKFAIWNGHLPDDMISQGHHTFCIIEFESGIPEILHPLPTWEDIQAGQYEYFRFGLCMKEDAELILANVNR